MVATRSVARAGPVRVPKVHGFAVYRKAVEVDPDATTRLAMLARSKGVTIFNPDAHRVQRELPCDDAVVIALVEALCARQLTLGRTAGSAVVLHSFGGCAQQPFHTDYDPSYMCSDAPKPLGVLLALQDDTRFCVPDDESVTLQTGDMVVFDGDQVHAGAAYTQPNTRIHMYLDLPSVHRPKNTTYLVP